LKVVKNIKEALAMLSDMEADKAKKKVKKGKGLTAEQAAVIRDRILGGK
jgi:hypothetical protein